MNLYNCFSALVLCVLVQLGSSTSHSRCGHGSAAVQDALQSKIQQAAKSKKATLEMRSRAGIRERSGLVSRVYSSSTAIRILADYSEIGTGAFADRIRNDIVPKAIAEIRRRIGLKNPVQGNLYLPILCLSWWDVGGVIYCAEVDVSEAAPGFCSTSTLGIANNWDYYGSYQLCTGPSEDQCTTYPAQTGAPDTDFIVYISARDTECGGSTLAYAAACELDESTNRPLAGYINFCSAVI